jgi:hypothetical protein
MCENAIEYMSEKACNPLVKDLINVRASDSIVQIRKLVIEMFGELDANEL